MIKNIIDQINNSPEPLKSYIHDLETTMGNVAHLIQDNFVLREQNEELKAYLKVKE
jgi:hypothetical protein